MKNLKILLDKVAEGKTSSKYDMDPDIVRELLDEFQDEFIESLLLNGYALLTPDLRIDVVPIQHRKYVLKGKEYRSTRIYKLKASMGEPVYERICGRYDQFRDDLGEDD